MKWTKLTLLSGLALAVMAVPAAEAQRRGGGDGGRRGGGPSISGARMQGGGSSRAFTNRSGGGRQFNSGERGRRWSGGDGGRRWRGGDGRRWRGDGRRWGRHRGHHHHRRFYRPRFSGYYGGFGYPYYYGGFGYPYGYGYGYPYYGSSVSLYYNGYNPGRQIYEGRAVNGGNGSLIARVQQELASGGYYRGAIDGVIGNGTRSAIRAYERDNGLRVDGRIDSQLLSNMGLG